MEYPIPIKRAGDRLSAEHINRLGRGVARIEGLRAHGFATTRNRYDQVSVITPPPFHQGRFEVSSVTIDDDDTASSGLYLIKRRYYSQTSGEWVLDDDTVYELDSRDFCARCRLLVGDRITAHWDGFLGRFVPLSVPIFRKGVVSSEGGIPVDGSGNVTVYRNGVATDWVAECWLDWIHGDEPVSNGKRVEMLFYPDEDDGLGRWNVHLADCEDT